MHSPPPQVDLTTCDREPIHIPGSIQEHGVLLACDRLVQVVVRHSANAGEILGLEGAINGARLSALIGIHAEHEIRNAVSQANDPARPAMLFGLKLMSGKRFDVAVHSHDDQVLIEFERADADAGAPLVLVRGLVGWISKIQDTDRLQREAAYLIQNVLGYDRVMVYRFEADGAGQVVSESKRKDLESFLGQYFPASDIPVQARALYLRNTIRVIGDANGVPVPVVPVIDSAGAPLDLSFAHLRSVSPIHCEYLRNMGVAASMSISIIMDGTLWGLIACHHYAPRPVPMARRVAAEMFGEFFSLHLNALRQKRRLDTATEARRNLDLFLRLAAQHSDVGRVIREHLPDFAALMRCDGIGVWMDGAWKGYGITPPDAAIPPLTHFIGTVCQGKVWDTHTLAAEFPEAGAYAADASGVLAIPISQRPQDYLLFFRREVVQTLNWAGNPDKSYDTGPLGDRLTPRKSFAIWKETVDKQATPWSEADAEIGEVARSALVEIILRHNEMLTEERAKADVRQRTLNEELNHRVKNILAVIKSLVSYPVEQGQSLEAYADALKGRIGALAHAHDQVVRGDGGGFLISLLDAELGPYRGATDVTLQGEGLWLDARAYSVMALVLHELSTNSAKYGPLSRHGGALDVGWALTPAGDCEILWRESGGPEVTPPTREGFGSILLTRSIAHDLGGESQIDYAPEGVSARILIPARHVCAVDAELNTDLSDVPALAEIATGGAVPDLPVADAEPPARAAEPSPVAAPADAGLPAAACPETSPDRAALAILLVEDQMLVALDVESMLADNGFTHVMTAASAADALRRLETLSPDVAVLDVNLGAGTSLPVARELAKRNIPFIFATGYGDSSMIPGEFAGVAVVRKPYDTRALIPAILRAMAPKAE